MQDLTYQIVSSDLLPQQTMMAKHTSPAPEITFYLHTAMAIFPMVAVVLILTNKIPLSKEE